MFRIVFFVVFASMFVPNWCLGVDYLNQNLNSSLIQPLCQAFCYPKTQLFLQPLQDSLLKHLFFCAYCPKPPSTQKPGTKPTTVTPSSMDTKSTTPAPSTMDTKSTTPAPSTGTKKPASETPSAEVTKAPGSAPVEQPPAPPAASGNQTPT